MRLSIGAALLGLAFAKKTSAQETYPNFVISARLQTQFYAFDNENDPRTGSSSNFFLRRARIQLNAKLRENISLVIQPSFEGGRSTGVRLRDAYLDLRATKASSRTSVTLRMGAEKKPFNRYELISSNNLPSLERNAGRGLLPVASNNLFEAGGYLATDLGASMLVGHQFDAHRRFGLQLGIYNGQGESVNDVNGSKSFGVRATVDLTNKLGLGASFFSHEGIVTVSPTQIDSSLRNSGFGLEAQWGQPGAAGLFVVADYLRGEAFTASKAIQSGLSLVGAYLIRTPRTNAIYGVEPVLRLDLADPNTGMEDNGSRLITAGINLYLTPRAQLRVMFESQNPESPTGRTISGLRTAWTMSF
jgi:hypothetical protein